MCVPSSALLGLRETALGELREQRDVIQARLERERSRLQQGKFFNLNYGTMAFLGWLVGRNRRAAATRAAFF